MKEKSKVSMLHAAIRREIGFSAYFCQLMRILFIPSYIISIAFIILGAVFMSGGTMTMAQYLIGVVVIFAGLAIEFILGMITFYDATLVNVVPVYSGGLFVMATFRVESVVIGQRYIDIEIDRRDINYYVNNEAFANPYELH